MPNAVNPAAAPVKELCKNSLRWAIAASFPTLVPSTVIGPYNPRQHPGRSGNASGNKVEFVMARETVRLAEYAAGLRYQDLPRDVVQRRHSPSRRNKAARVVTWLRRWSLGSK